MGDDILCSEQGQQVILFFLSCLAIPISETAEAGSGSDCSTSCSFSTHHQPEPISEQEWLQTLKQWSTEPVGEATPSLELILFHSSQSQYFLLQHGELLDEEHLYFLQTELSRDQLRIEMRLVDEEGSLRGYVESGSFPQEEKQHLAFANTGSLGWLETAGRVRRVGLDHWWSRW